MSDNNINIIEAANKIAAEKTVINKPFPVTLIVGGSGTGKSYSIRNLPPAQTCIINVENKTLPFRNAFNFTKVVTEEIPAKIDQAIQAALRDPEIKYIVLDSFTKYCEFQLNLCGKTFKGYDIYKEYNQRIFDLLERIKKNTSKFIIILAIDELVEMMNPNGTKFHSRRCAVSGKAWEGKIEKEFTLVLWTDVMREAGTTNTAFSFLTSHDGISAAKSPAEMFQPKIQNDLLFVCNRITEYYGLK